MVHGAYGIINIWLNTTHQSQFHKFQLYFVIKLFKFSITFSLVLLASLDFHNIMVGWGVGGAMELSQKAIYSSEMFTVFCRDSSVYLLGHVNML